MSLDLSSSLSLLRSLNKIYYTYFGYITIITRCSVEHHPTPYVELRQNGYNNVYLNIMGNDDESEMIVNL